MSLKSEEYKGIKEPPVPLALKFSFLKDKILPGTQPNIEPYNTVYTKNTGVSRSGLEPNPLSTAVLCLRVVWRENIANQLREPSTSKL